MNTYERASAPSGRRRTVQTIAVSIAGAMLIAIGGGAALAATPAAPAPRFVAPADASSGGTLPQQVATADYNGDGATDVAAANQGPIPVFGSSIGVSLGNGNGGLSAPVTTDLPSSEGACDIGAGNFDNSGGADVAVLSCTTGGASNIVALTADGDGSFTASQQLTNTDGGQLATADFNGDDVDDIAFSRRGSPEVRIYLGKGNGTFKAPIVTNPTWDSYDVMAGDVDHDGDPDLVGAAGGPVWTMLNDGTGHLGAQVFDFSNELSGIELALGFFNADPNLDVAVVDASGGHVFVAVGQGNGRFTPTQTLGPIALQVNWVAAGDLTGDAKDDLVADIDTNSSALFAGNGDGTFGKTTRWATGSEGLTVTDLDGKAPRDLVTFTSDPGVVHGTVATKKGFRAAQLIRGPAPQAAGDLDNNGTLDKVTGAPVFVKPGVIRSQVMAQLNNGKGKFGKVIVSKVRKESASSGIGAIALGDIDEDGFLDVVGGFDNFQPSPNNLFWMIGNGDGSFGQLELSTTGEVHADVTSLALGFVNADQHLDIVSHTLSQLSVRLGNGDGTFGQPIVSGSSGPDQPATLLADFTGDGTPDVVAVHRTGNEDFGDSDILLEKDAGDGTFTLVQTRAVDSNIHEGEAADFNGDGRPDVAVIGSRGFNGGRNALWILLTTPSGELGTPVPYQGPASGLAVADYDLDGDPDIAVNGINTFVVYVNAGDGTFPSTVAFLSPGGVTVPGDFTGDGAPDLITSSGELGGSFALFINAV
jgi:hypothetical protein